MPKGHHVLTQGLLYQNQLNPVAELDASGNVVSRFIYATRSNAPDLMIKGGRTYRILTDHLGSPRLVIDTSTGAVSQRIDYDEYGRVLFDSNPGFQPFGFAGGLFDSQAGLVRFGARDYDPAVGRWTAKDPVQFNGDSPNLYEYVLSDPITSFDHTGKSAIATATYGGTIGGPVRAAVGFAIGWYGGKAILDHIFNSESKKDVPSQGPPGQWIDGGRRLRKYGEDGFPDVDIDLGHQGHEEPHVHEWKGRRNEDREHPGRPVCPIPKK